MSCLDGELDIARAGEALALRGGETITWKPDGSALREKADPVRVLAWRKGLLIFDGTPLSVVVAEINRHYPGRLVLRGRGLESRTVTGAFHTDQIDLALVQIKRLTKVTSTELPGGVVLLG